MFYVTRRSLSLIVSALFTLTAFSEETVEFDSTVVSSVRYDRETRELTVRKVNEAEVVYRGVPEKVFRGFVEAPLKGGYYRGSIEGLYEVVSREEGDPDISLPSPVSDAPVDEKSVTQEVLQNLNRADSTLNKIRTGVPGVDVPRKKVGEAKAILKRGGDQSKVSSLIDSASQDVRSLESRYAKEVSDAKSEIRKLEMEKSNDNTLEVTRLNSVIGRADPLVSDLIRASNALRAAQKNLQRVP